jgi:hypothetical protein
MQQFRCMYSCSRCKQQYPMCDDAGELNYFRCVVCDSIVCSECVALSSDDKESEDDTSCICAQCVKDGY